MVKSNSKLNDRWFRIAGIPVVTCLLTFSFGISMITIFHQPVSKVFATYLIISLIYWESCRWVIMQARKKFEGISQTSKRIAVEITSVVLIVAALSISTTYFFDKTLYWGFEEMKEDYFYYFGFNLIYMLMVAAIYESVYFFRISIKSIKEQDELKRINMLAQLDALKNQINPHFLFNSLNSLSSLIDENADAAKDYVDELSSVYRYVLQSNERELSTVKEELDFIYAYFFLLKTRHGEHIKEEINVAEKFYSLKLPPLTLQVLIENAVKHNMITADKPLQIKISSAQNNSLLIVNNLQKKNQLVPSYKIGLSNIKKRFEILGKGGITIAETPSEFKVTVLLLD